MNTSSPKAETVHFRNSDDIHTKVHFVLQDISRIMLSELNPSLEGEIKIEHIGSTAIPNSLTKGDLDVLCIVENQDFIKAKQIFSRLFSTNFGTEDMDGFSSFECPHYEQSHQISVGIQLMKISASQPPFLWWRELLLSDTSIRTEYDTLKLQFDGKAMNAYRKAKEKLICKYLPDENSNEYKIFDLIKRHISNLQLQKNKPLRIAISGIEGTGKTIFAKKLTFYLIQNKLNAIHVTIDGFHFKKAHRYRQGRDSAKGYYEDSYDEQAFVNTVLLASQADPAHYTTATHDLESDEYLNLKPIPLSSDALLITDGAYLYKPIYREHWDLKIYLKTDQAVALQRGIERDQECLGGTEAAKVKFLTRYHAASQLYINECKPESAADIVIDNTNFNKLRIVVND